MTISSEKFRKIKRLMRQYDELSDAAFFAVLAEHGVDADDLVEYTEEEERRKARRK